MGAIKHKKSRARIESQAEKHVFGDSYDHDDVGRGERCKLFWHITFCPLHICVGK
jgi:hypothetical protein